MSRPKCGICHMVGGAMEGTIRCHRSGTSREYLVRSCVACWLALMYILEDVAAGYTDSLPIETTAASNKAFVTRHRNKVAADARDLVHADHNTQR